MKSLLCRISVSLLTSLLVNTAAHALPSQLTFINNTSITLGTAISGYSGYPVQPNVSVPVSYTLVSIGCQLTGQMNNCPLEFSDKATGEKIVTVYLNAETATFNQPPVFFGSYANELDLLGWEASPISEISIVRKA